MGLLMLKWLFGFFERKKKEILAGSQQVLNSFENSWSEFCKKETYLTTKTKKQLLSILDSYEKTTRIPWYLFFAFNLKRQLSDNQSKIIKYGENLLEFNPMFVKSRLIEHKKLFDGEINGTSLDQEQRNAIVVDDAVNLIVAAAGSGKSTVLLNKILYLNRRKDKIDSERILILAFNRKVANDLKNKLKTTYHLPNVVVETFHSFGLKVLQKESKQSLLFDGSEEDAKYLTLIKELFISLLKSNKFQELFVDYISYYGEEDIDEISFEKKEQYYNYVRTRRYTTLNNVPVKSVAERNIANFFFIHGIKFEYEPAVRWSDQIDGKEYHPDFYLPEYDIYIEHWGVNEEMKVPEWFNKTSSEYCAEMEWKRRQFKKYDKLLIETWQYDAHSGRLLEDLRKKIQGAVPEIEFKRLSYADLVNKTFAFKESYDEFTKLMWTFIKLAKSNALSPQEIRKRIESDQYSNKQKCFGRLAAEVFIVYEKCLHEKNKIDFADMINQGVEIVKSSNYGSKFDYVLVDEFQDISTQRLNLLKAILQSSSQPKLFCVGDDWQSIYRFAGSDVSIFVDFENFFSDPEILQLSTNYRCSKSIIDISNHLIKFNKTKREKVVKSKSAITRPPVLYVLADSEKNYERNETKILVEEIKKLIAKGVMPSEIMILSRYNKNLMELKYGLNEERIPISEKHNAGIVLLSIHRAKGLESKYVFILDVSEGRMGFPCQIQDSSVLKIVKPDSREDPVEEERRLFYVALTRSKEYLYIFTRKDSKSVFIYEIEKFVDTKFS